MKNPKNGAERMRQLRQRAASLLAEPAAIPLAADSTIIEAIPLAYRQELPGTLALLAAELIKRMGASVTVTIPPP